MTQIIFTAVDIARIIAENLPSPYALDAVWKLDPEDNASDVPQFSLERQPDYVVSEWYKLVEAIMVELVKQIENCKVEPNDSNDEGANGFNDGIDAAIAQLKKVWK